jgi:L-lactate utilization protein LutC
MSLTEILEQVKALSQAEREELLTELQEMQNKSAAQEAAQPEQEWGKALNRLLNEMGSVELLYPEIDDPVEWVQRLRDDERRRRLDELAD